MTHSPPSKQASKQVVRTGRYLPVTLDSREGCDMNLDVETTKTAKMFHGLGKIARNEEKEVYEHALIVLKSSSLP